MHLQRDPLSHPSEQPVSEAKEDHLDLDQTGFFGDCKLE
jgi:hypothetical protein